MSTKEHWEDALDRANLVRFGRAAMKKGLRRGELTLTDALVNPFAQTMLVFDVLTLMPRMHSGRAQVALVNCGIGLYATTGQLTERQKLALSEWVV